jgi:hypothetical protein
MYFRFFQVPFLSSLLLIVLNTDVSAEPNPFKNTFCNPLNLDYNFYADYREAADPCIIYFKNDYYLFASHCEGYWWSPDMNKWNLVRPTGINLTDYAPSVEVIGETLYFTAGASSLYKSTDPKSGAWSTATTAVLTDADPCLFRDDDGKFYCYSGCSANGTIDVIQVDPSKNFSVIGTKGICIRSNRQEHGFEVPGDNNELLNGDSWIEGAWMTKHAGIYYLQYAVPGTEMRSYSDGCYTATSPIGPFTFCTNSPMCMKSGGFVTGTGHSCTFLDAFGKFWHITSATVSVIHKFERRLALFPTAFDSTGLLHTDTYMGDYPQYLPGKAPSGASSNLVPGTLLSFGKNATASSTLSNRPIVNAFDENIRTWWSASSSNSGEWLQVDLGKQCAIGAIQVNFAEQDINYTGGRGTMFSHEYKIECSDNSSGPWNVVVDKSSNTTDVPHDYVVFDSLVRKQFVKITNAGPMPGSGKFAIRDLRVFGSATCTPPSGVQSFTVERSSSDKRMVKISWNKVSDVQGYIIRLGSAPDKLYNNYQITGSDSTLHVIRSLNTGTKYYFTIDSYSECGITKSGLVKSDDNAVVSISNNMQKKPDQNISDVVYKSIGGKVIIPPIPGRNLFKLDVYDISGRLLFNRIIKSENPDLSEIGCRSSKFYLVHFKPIE